ncbi:MAG TPA: ATP-binding cassette domain-containing protein [Solirubrobacteraceae bacterium]|nr:ATP-binding cassette domain-containing protein [Solirubrobacteraceae bacterium]
MPGASVSPAGVVAHSLAKRFGEKWALRDFDLEVPRGSVLGLLGHNGAGKTTAIRILTTLTLPTSGGAEVAGLDVLAEPARVRERIGLAGQYASVDDLLTASANLEMVGRLYHLTREEAARRAAELLERLGLADVAGDLVRTFSGGMRRRLDLAASLMGGPEVLFLDEPTTGLDPQARSELWELIGQQLAGGTTVILTTQYLEEADRLADTVVVLDHGRTVAAGAPRELKASVGGGRVALRLGAAGLERAAETVAPFATGPIEREESEQRLSFPVDARTRLVDVLRSLDGAGVDVADLQRVEPTLDDVFLSLTTGGGTPS